MKKKLTIMVKFELTSQILDDIKNKISGLCTYCSPYLTLDNITDEECNNVISLLHSLGCFEICLKLDYYTMEELEHFNFFYCTGQINPSSGINFCSDVYKINNNSSFDYSNYCPKCNMGYKQIAPLIIKGLSKKLQTKKIITPFWTFWMVSSSLKDKILKENISGVDFWELYNNKHQSFASFLQIKPKKIIINALDLNHVKQTNSGCICKNISVAFSENTIKLYESVKNQLSDFNELNVNHISRLNGMYIISKKLLKLFVEENIIPHKDIEIYPVDFV